MPALPTSTVRIKGDQDDPAMMHQIPQTCMAFYHCIDARGVRFNDNLQPLRQVSQAFAVVHGFEGQSDRQVAMVARQHTYISDRIMDSFPTTAEPLRIDR